MTSSDGLGRFFYEAKVQKIRELYTFHIKKVVSQAQGVCWTRNIAREIEDWLRRIYISTKLISLIFRKFAFCIVFS